MNPTEPLINNTIDLVEFGAHCREILGQLTTQGIVLTEAGQPVARIIPLRPINTEPLFGALKDEIIINGDIFSTGVEWNAES